MLIGLEVQGQIPLQGLQDGGRMRQGQTLPKDPRVGLTDLAGRQRKEEAGKVE